MSDEQQTNNRTALYIGIIGAITTSLLSLIFALLLDIRSGYRQLTDEIVAIKIDVATNYAKKIELKEHAEQERNR